MVKLWLAGLAGLLMTSTVAVAQDAPISSPSTTPTSIDRSASQEGGMLTERTRTYQTQQPSPVVVVPPTTETTTVERTITVEPQ
ncbi:hypothetical protein GCM10011611_19360 [Aliidongia dinghuensis]|uniref:Uncharacterized protein n=1 Tax=Aliidongia dinghuensis TaxID=1867774 RepID=A0A8J3E4E2_9PROT|nr:hypothetical protein [Aliidongia dinghuensis]GGF13762.1 hypothetical protein GCM10011611_19360 [Aliidongia dinghuensis]